MGQASIHTPIFHITDLENLPSILDGGGLVSFNEMRKNGVEYRSIAYKTIQDRRAWTPVPCGPGGTLHDYVPFYFAPRSPMLYTISRGNVPDRQQQNVIYVMASAQETAARGIGFVFTDGHGIMVMTDFFDDLGDLDKIDWDVMKAQYWADTDEDPDRSRRRQAEFLVFQFFPFDLVSEIATVARSTANKAEKMLQIQSHRPVVTVRPNWYY